MAPTRLGLYCVLIVLVLIICDAAAWRYSQLEDATRRAQSEIRGIAATERNVETILTGSAAAASAALEDNRRITGPTGLALDPDLDANQLADALGGALSLRLERLSAVYGLAMDEVQGEALTLDRRTAIARAIGAAESAEPVLVSNLRTAYAANPRLRAPLENPLRDATDSADKLLGSIAGATGDGRRPAASDARAFAAQRRGVVESNRHLAAILGTEIRRLLNERIAHLRGERLLLSLGVGAGIALTLALVLAMVLALSRRRRRELNRSQREAAAFYTELARQRAERALLLNQAQFRAVFDRSPMGIALLDGAGTTLESNAALKSMAGEATPQLVHGNDPEFGALVEGRVAIYRCERTWMRADGGRVSAELTVSPVVSPESSIVVAIAMVQDVTERNAADESLRHAATHDAMTALPNRPQFMRALEETLAEDTGLRHAAVLFIDLDSFKLINDSRGHHAGDRVIRATAERLRGIVRNGDVAARFHGDEFALLLRRIDDPRIAAALAERVQRELRAPIELDDGPSFVTPSIGVVLGDDRYRSADAVVRDADAAMYHAKSQGGSRTVFFDDSMQEALVERMRIATDIRSGIERSQFRLVFQPVVDLTDGGVVAFETLLRWHHPLRGEISPDAFIPIAEESNAILDLGRFALEQACITLAELSRDLPRKTPLNLSVNLSAVQFTQGTIVEEVRDALASSGLSAERLLLEITESALIENGQRAADVLRRLKALGVRLAIDDFGTGYSSLRYLHEFPIDILKIERSFVGGEGAGLANEPIVIMLLTLAESLGLDVIAEGIETQDQRRILRRAGCAYGQGFLFGKPLERDQIEPWLAANAKTLRPRLLAAR